jgi:Family of unknown function (DUF5767)
MESIDLKMDDLEPININFGDPKQSDEGSSYGGGIELLMNDKIKKQNSSTVIDMNDLDDLETELNDLSSGLNGAGSSSGNNDTKSVSSNFSMSNFFGFGNKKNDESVKIVIEEKSDSNVGHATVDSMGSTRTWDGYSKINEVPTKSNYASSSTNLSDREKRRKKRSMLRSLDDWYERGIIKNSSHFTMDSNYEEIEDEYEGALEDKRKRDAVKLQQNWLITAINTIEYGNAFLNPFDIQLDGWGEAVSEDIDSYNEIMEQLYDKYKGGKLSPELALLMKLGFSACVAHYSNKALSTAAPGFGDVMRQNPDLMKMFTNATVESMKQASPGMAFASDLLNNNKPTPMTGFPPAPVETRNQPAPPASSRPGMQFTQMPSNRPDINASRGVMFQERGVEMNNSFQNFNQPMNMPPPQPAQQQERSMARPPDSSPVQRPEMSGPKITDLDNILSGLKTKPTAMDSMPQQPTQPVVNQPIRNMTGTPTYMEEDSMISISSLKDMQGSLMPKKSNRRKPRSDKNVISLDL